jgi:hypothetical protein
MIPLKEHLLIEAELNNLMEADVVPQFTDEQIEKAEYFDLKWNAVTGKTMLCIYDENGEGLASVGFDDAEIAMAYAEEVFDMDEEDSMDMLSYAWTDNLEDRVYDALQDDGTSEP